MGPVKAGASSGDAKAGAVTTSGGRLNVRSGASSASPVVGTLPKGSYITLLSRHSDWWYVRYGKGSYGYCHKDYITVVEGRAASVATASGGLNVRSGPGTSYAKTAVLNKGERVIVLSDSGDWSRVLYHGTKTGYVSSRYLSGGNSPVSLNLPDYKQTDPRWASVPVGQSGKPISQIGCATTAIAMMESHRTGEEITPDKMVRRLNYTPSGSVYWPEHYRAVTNGNGYLAGIYARLREGKPVLLGAKNAHGKQHWVVITGFTGGELRAAGFTIRDPGSKARVNLQQFLDAYPVFYKYFDWA